VAMNSVMARNAPISGSAAPRDARILSLKAVQYFPSEDWCRTVFSSDRNRCLICDDRGNR
jgi:hypothetical protein